MRCHKLVVQALIGACSPRITQAVQVLAERFKSDLENQGKGGINISMLAADDKVRGKW